MDVMRCSGCDGEYTSVWALDACEREHEEDDARNREWLRAHPTGAVQRDTIQG